MATVLSLCVCVCVKGKQGGKVWVRWEDGREIKGRRDRIGGREGEREMREGERKREALKQRKKVTDREEREIEIEN